METAATSTALPAAPLADPRQTAYALRTGRGSREERALEASRQFVGLFLGECLKNMRETVHQGEIGHGGTGERVFQAMMDEEMGATMARSEQFGLTRLVYQSLMRPAGLAANGRTDDA